MSSGTPSRWWSSLDISIGIHCTARLAPLVKAVSPTPSSGAARIWESNPGMMPWCSTTGCPPAVRRQNASPARYPGMGLVLGGEHAGKRRGFEHGAVLVGATTQEGREIPRHVFGRGVDTAGSCRHDFTVSDGLGAGRAQLAPRREPRLDHLGSCEGGVGHTEGFEDVTAEVAVQGRRTHVLDNLAQRRGPVVCVPEHGARLRVEPQPTSVVVGEEGTGRPSFTLSPKSVRDMPERGTCSGIPAVWVSRCRTVAGRQLVFAGISW